MRYAKLVNGEIMVIYSDNIDDATMNLYYLHYDGHFDPEVNIANEYSYEYIVGIASTVKELEKMA